MFNHSQIDLYKKIMIDPLFRDYLNKISNNDTAGNKPKCDFNDKTT